jgi:hypothetical protein
VRPSQRLVTAGKGTAFNNCGIADPSGTVAGDGYSTASIGTAGTKLSEANRLGDCFSTRISRLVFSGAEPPLVVRYLPAAWMLPRIILKLLFVIYFI